MTMTDPFAKLGEFQPRPAAEAKPVPSAARIAVLGDQHGFSINNFDEKPRAFQTRRISRTPQTVAKTIRIRASDWNKFVGYCEQMNCTAAEGFALLISTITPENGPTLTEGV
jgi:hypothetical protein